MMTMKKSEYLKCMVCGDIRPVKRLKPFEGTLVKCEECGLVFRNPMPSDKKITDYYKKSYSDIFDEEKIKSHRQEIFLNFLKNARRYLSRGRRLLDVGCGYGFFLNLAKDQGWEVYGVELSKDACQFAQRKLGSNIFCGGLKEASFLSDHFDVVTLWNVLDHMTDPQQQLPEIKRILKNDGLLFLRLPNFLFQEKARRIGNAFDNLFFGHTNLSQKISVSHLYAFTPYSIINLLENEEFSPFLVRNALPSKGNPYKIYPFLGEKLINWIKKSYFFACEFLYQLSASNILWSPSMEVFAFKEEWIT
jgi:2-polyprenyl-3-methyl-5-hydroxy-6-metoxy-1,4-benzoquinol methylase